MHTVNEFIGILGEEKCIIVEDLYMEMLRESSRLVLDEVELVFVSI